MKLWTCDKCKTVVREDTGAPVGWTINLFAGINPICPSCQPLPAKGDLKPEKGARHE